MTDETKEGWVKDHASDISTFFKALVSAGVPETTASNLAQELNHQSLRARFKH